MSDSNNINRELKFRRRLAVAAFLGAAATLVWRAVDLQLHEKEFLQSAGDARHLRVEQIYANRGMIVDRNGEPLAISTPTLSAWIKPTEFIDARNQWDEVAAIIGTTVEHLETLVLPRAQRQFVYLKRHLNPDQGSAIKALHINGLNLQGEYRRYYPGAELSAHVIGFTNVDDQGQEGIELAFDRVLRGEPGLRRVIKDRIGRVVEDVERLQPIRPGQDIRLSIDERVQYVAYRMLKNAVHAHRARAASMVVVDTQNGEIIALVNQPSFNPNNRAELKGEHYRNRAVTDLFEPGSTIKPFTIAAALESASYKPDSVIDTAPGFFKVGSHTVRDVRNFGRLSIAGIIEKSSNVGASKVALSMEPEVLWRTLRAVGLGSVTEVSLPGEVYGKLKEYVNWHEIEHATLAFGYGLAITTVQLARAYTVLANDGWLQPLSIVRLDAPPPRIRALRADTAIAVRQMLETVVLRGTGQEAQIPGYTVAGKTGTVHKSIVSGYAEDRYLSLFAGMIPATKPRLVAVVLIDEPQSGEHFGGRVAAPIFADVMGEATRILNIAPDVVAPANGVDVWLAAGLPPSQAGGDTMMATTTTAPRLSTLVAGYAQVSAGDDREVLDITADSRAVVSGGCFVALQGSAANGLDFVHDAVTRGAVAVLTEAPVQTPAIKLPPSTVPIIVVPDLQRRLGEIANRFFDEPSKTVRVFAVTGTNGKTTVAHLLAQALVRLEGGCGYIGTLGMGLPHALRPAVNTTPDVFTINRELADLRANNIAACALEASSHALSQRRLAGLHIAAAGFTNLGHDHLDYHADVDDYAAAKRGLFSAPYPAAAVFNLDDKLGAQMADDWPESLPSWTCSSHLQAGAQVNVSASAIESTAQGQRFTLSYGGEHVRVHTTLVGRFNVDNLLLIVGTLLSAGYRFAQIHPLLADLKGVPGRMEFCGHSPTGARIYIDYAHTPDSLAAALSAFRDLKPDILHVVFGCGGDRDQAKRPLMGAQAARFADRITITSDNPRNETSDAIAQQVLVGIESPAAVEVTHDREQAINAAIASAGQHDIVVIAGKGHEAVQIFGDEQRSFSDHTAVQNALSGSVS